METSIKQQLDTVASGTKTERKTYVCENCGRKYKTNSGLFKHLRKCDNTKNEVYDQLNTENKPVRTFMGQVIPQQVQVAQKSAEESRVNTELLSMLINNPNINLSSSITPDLMDKLNRMTIEEKKLKIFELKRKVGNMLDARYSDTFVSLATTLIGGILGCKAELSAINEGDKLLKESAQELISYKLGLAFLPPEIKCSGLFITNVATAWMEARDKASLKAEEEKEMIVVQEPVVEQEEVLEIKVDTTEMVEEQPEKVIQTGSTGMTYVNSDMEEKYEDEHKSGLSNLSLSF